MEIKLGDFGLAAKLLEDDDRRYTVCGTPNYIAPEVLEQKGHSYAVDMWALGVLVFTLIVGIPPFETPHVKTTYKLIKDVKFTFPEDIPISSDARDLIGNLLLYDTSERLDLLKVVNHPFMAIPAPDLLPLSTLSCPPSAAYIRQYIKKESIDVITAEVTKREYDQLDEQLNKSTGREDLNQQFIENKSKDETKSETSKNTSIDNYRTIERFIDYSAKYGIGYIFDNKDIGVLFNDHTSLLHPYLSP